MLQLTHHCTSNGIGAVTENKPFGTDNGAVSVKCTTYLQWGQLHVTAALVFPNASFIRARKAVTYLLLICYLSDYCISDDDFLVLCLATTSAAYLEE